MGSSIVKLATAHHALGQGRGACVALALPLTLSGMCYSLPKWFANTIVFANHNCFALSLRTDIQSIA